MKRFIASTKIFSHPKPREQVYHLLSANPFRGSIFLNTKCNEQGYILFFLAHRTKRHYHSTKYKHFHAIIYSCGSDSIQRPVYCQSPAFDNRFQPIAYKDTRATLEKFFAGKEGKTIYSYLKPLTLVDEDKSIFGLYAKSGVPRCVIIGKNGVIAYVGIGSSEEGLKEVAQTLREELAK